MTRSMIANHVMISMPFLSIWKKRRLLETWGCIELHSAEKAKGYRGMMRLGYNLKMLRLPTEAQEGRSI